MRAVDEGRRAIGLIDGVFESGPSVWHKEILYALHRGCHVLGAASIGALRAAECQVFGMVGIGDIFVEYKSGRRVSDGDVALTYGPAELGYPPLTLPLVDADHALGVLLGRGRLDECEASSLARRARKIFFKERTWQRVLACEGLPDARTAKILAEIDALGPGRKALDAHALLERIERGDHGPPPRLAESRSTLFLDALRDNRSLQ